MKNVNFAIREIGELYSLDFLISEFKDLGINWNIYIIPYNSDLKLFSSSNFLKNHNNIKIIDGSNGLDASCIGFKTDISGKFEEQVKSEIDIYELAACMDMRNYSDINSDKYDIVVSNVKINDKKKEKEYNPKMWKLLGKLPYSIAVVPRHPFPEGFLDGINIPENVTVINKVGVLKTLCANTSLVVMGLIFSNREGEMDHSPLEATINSNAISGFYDEIEDGYKDFYKNSGLIHRYSSFEESIDSIPNLINDSKLKEKLENKQILIKKNKEKYLKKVLNILLKN